MLLREPGGVRLLAGATVEQRIDGQRARPVGRRPELPREIGHDEANAPGQVGFGHRRGGGGSFWTTQAPPIAATASIAAGERATSAGNSIAGGFDGVGGIGDYLLHCAMKSAFSRGSSSSARLWRSSRRAHTGELFGSCAGARAGPPALGGWTAIAGFAMGFDALDVGASVAIVVDEDEDEGERDASGVGVASTLGAAAVSVCRVAVHQATPADAQASATAAVNAAPVREREGPRSTAASRAHSAAVFGVGAGIHWVCPVAAGTVAAGCSLSVRAMRSTAPVFPGGAERGNRCGELPDAPNRRSGTSRGTASPPPSKARGPAGWSCARSGGGDVAMTGGDDAGMVRRRTPAGASEARRAPCRSTTRRSARRPTRPTAPAPATCNGRSRASPWSGVSRDSSPDAWVFEMPKSSTLTSGVPSVAGRGTGSPA